MEKHFDDYLFFGFCDRHKTRAPKVNALWSKIGKEVVTLLKNSKITSVSLWRSPLFSCSLIKHFLCVLFVLKNEKMKLESSARWKSDFSLWLGQKIQPSLVHSFHGYFFWKRRKTECENNWLLNGHYAADVHKSFVSEMKSGWKWKAENKNGQRNEEKKLSWRSGRRRRRN